METGELRFSASYASRYHNCHGSANLKEAIPGFEFPERDDNTGMRDQGSKLHEIFQAALSSGNKLDQCALLLQEISEVWGPKRLALLEDEKAYIVWWFMKHKTEPPIDWKDMHKLVWDSPITVKKPESKRVTVPPLRLVFLANALMYVQGVVNDKLERWPNSDIKYRIEETAEAEWLVTKPRTTVDLVIYNDNEMEVLDLKMGDIEIPAENNTQLMYYAWTFGAEKYDQVTVHILQRNNINKWTVTREALHHWSQSLQESERAILRNDLTLNPGGHCTFCPANPHGRGERGSKPCPAMMKLIYGERDIMVSDANVLEDD